MNPINFESLCELIKNLANGEIVTLKTLMQSDITQASSGVESTIQVISDYQANLREMNFFAETALKYLQNKRS